jgi:hypothetical protein
MLPDCVQFFIAPPGIQSRMFFGRVNQSPFIAQKIVLVITLLNSFYPKRHFFIFVFFPTASLPAAIFIPTSLVKKLDM